MPQVRNLGVRGMRVPHQDRALAVERQAQAHIDELENSLREMLGMIALLPEDHLSYLATDPFGKIGDALQALGQSRDPDSWRALHRFCHLPDPGPKLGNQSGVLP